MGRSTRPLGERDFERFAEPLSLCMDYAIEPVVLGTLGDDEAMFDVKHRWFHEVEQAWGRCGVALDLPGHDAAGYVIWAPPALSPGAQNHPTAPATPDAVLLHEVWVQPELRGSGLGKMLVQSAAADLVRRGEHKAIEAYASPRDGEGVLPRAFLEAIGFHVKREHPRQPRLRMDLRGSRRWVDEVEGRWERILDSLRGHTEPAAGKPAAGPVREITPV